MHEEVLAIRNSSKEEKRSETSPTIMHEILNSDLPTEDKSDKRLSEEAQLLLAAGLLTTSWALTLASFYITRNPRIVSQLRAELKGAGVTNAECSAWQKLERLKYLKGCVQEAIRLSIGIPIRNPRLAPNIELVYGKWKIPKNTPVSMTALHVLMNKEIFINPESFVPERWIDNADLERYFVPFGKGTRTCLGIK
jgi:cytochrome P450